MNNWKRRWQGILLGALLLSSSWAEAAPIEMQVVEGDVRSVLLSLARTAHENIVLDDSVAGTVTQDEVGHCQRRHQTWDGKHQKVHLQRQGGGHQRPGKQFKCAHDASSCGGTAVEGRLLNARRGV